MRSKIVFAVFMLAALITPLAFVAAADYLPKKADEGGNVVVSGDEQYRNLYVAGGSVAINQSILGDLFAAGGSVNVSESVENDLFAAGGNVTVSAQIGQDLRVAGGNLTINAPVGGDTLAAGGTISVSRGANISGDLWAAGGVVNISSTVAGGAKIAGGEIFINGTIVGPVEIRADNKLTFGPESRVAGPITYKGRNEAQIQDGAEVGEIQFTRMDKKDFGGAAAGLTIFYFLKLIALFVAGLVFLKIFGRSSQQIVSGAYTQFWSNLGLGLVGVIITPIIAIILLATVIGGYLGAMLMAWFVLVVLFGGVFTVMFVGALIEKWILKKEIALTWKTVVLGVIAGGIISLIPFIGWLAVLVAFLAIFGSGLRLARQRLEF